MYFVGELGGWGLCSWSAQRGKGSLYCMFCTEEVLFSSVLLYSPPPTAPPLSLVDRQTHVKTLPSHIGIRMITK